MNRVDFLERNEFHIRSRKIFGEPTTPTMITILVRSKIAKNEKQAIIILLSIIGLTLTLTSILLYFRINPSQSTTITDKYGNTYTFEQYIQLVRDGKDPLLPK